MRRVSDAARCGEQVAAWVTDAWKKSGGLTDSEIEAALRFDVAVYGWQTAIFRAHPSETPRWYPVPF